MRAFRPLDSGFRRNDDGSAVTASTVHGQGVGCRRGFACNDAAYENRFERVAEDSSPMSSKANLNVGV